MMVIFLMGSVSLFLPNDNMSFGMRGFLRKVSQTDGVQIGKSFNLENTGYALVVQRFHENCLYVGTAGEVTAHNSQNFNLVWRNELKGYGRDLAMTIVPYTTSISKTPCLLVGLGGYLVSLHAHSGLIQWNFCLENTGYGYVSILVYKHMVLTASAGKLFVVNGDDGKLISKDELEGFLYFEICLVSQACPMDQQSSNLIFSRDTKEKRKRK